MGWAWPRRSAGSRRAQLLVALTLASAALASCAESGSGSPVPLAPLVPADLSLLEPGLAAAIDAALTRVLANPDAADARLELAMIYDSNALVALAATTYGQALDLDPALARAAYHLAIARESFGDLEPALALMQRVIELAPEVSTAHGRLGQWLLEAGRFDEAKAAFEQAQALDPDHPLGPEGLARLALTRREPARAVELLGRWLERHPERRHSRYLLSIALRETGQQLAAARELEAATPSSPGWKDPWRSEVLEHVAGYHDVMDTAVALGRKGRAAQALPSLEALHTRDPTDLAVIEKLVGGYLQTERLDDALSCLAGALEKRPGHPRLLFLAALVHELAGRPRDALQVADEALAAQGSWAALHELRARLLWKAGRIDEAAQALRQAVDVGGDELANLLKLGRAHSLTDDWAGALEAFRRATEAHPSNGQSWALRAEAELELGESGAARTHIEHALGLDPGDKNVRRIAVRVASEAGADG